PSRRRKPERSLLEVPPLPSGPLRHRFRDALRRRFRDALHHQILTTPLPPLLQILTSGAAGPAVDLVPAAAGAGVANISHACCLSEQGPGCQAPLLVLAFAVQWRVCLPRDQPPDGPARAAAARVLPLCAFPRQLPRLTTTQNTSVQQQVQF
ncbi:unnamed protein product, partial [Urochloa humidicola]